MVRKGPAGSALKKNPPAIFVASMQIANTTGIINAEQSGFYRKLLETLPMKSRLNQVIDAYQKSHGPELDRVGHYTEQQKTLLSAIRVATQCKDHNGRRDSHQNRIRQITLDLWSEAVTRKFRQLRTASSFDQLHSILKVAKINGVGELTIYDSANRIGLFLKIWPDRIYLHAGTRIGLRNLMGKAKGPYVYKKSLPKDLQQSSLSCSAIENLLCIYKDALDPMLDKKPFQLAIRKATSRC
jgi:hypothetical protein